MSLGSWYHLSVKPVSRSAGRSVTAAASYRLGERIMDETYNLVHDYRARSGVAAKFTMAPADAPAWAHDPERLWNAAERAETRKNSTLAREVELALPASVSDEVRLHIVEAFSAELVDRYGVAVSAAIHRPHEGSLNHHCHILFTTREMTADGLGAKTRILDDRTTGPQEVTFLRGFACDLINQALADSGSDERVDHRSFVERGIEAEPTVHQGPAVSHMEARGEPTIVGDLNREIGEENDRLQSIQAMRDELAVVHEEITIRTAENFEQDLLITPGDAHSFADLHQRMLAQAAGEIGVMAAERAGGWADAIYDRVSRVRQWWLNLRDHIVEFRDHVHDQVQQFWEQQHRPPEPDRDDLEPQR